MHPSDLLSLLPLGNKFESANLKVLTTSLEDIPIVASTYHVVRFIINGLSFVSLVVVGHDGTCEPDGRTGRSVWLRESDGWMNGEKEGKGRDGDGEWLDGDLDVRD